MTKKKNILIISYSYPPSNAPAAQRPYSLAKYLDKEKYNITVITCSNADSSLGFDDSLNINLEGVRLIRIKAFLGTNTSKLRNSSMAGNKTSVFRIVKKGLFNLGSSFILPDKAIFWYPNVIKYLKENKDFIYKTDVVFTTSPLFTNHLIGSYIVKNNNLIKWLVDFRDFHYLESFSDKKGFHSLYYRYLEIKVVKKANSIIFVTDAMKKAYEQYYKEYKNKMNFIYNGFDQDDFKSFGISAIKNKKLIIFYAGSFYKGVRSPVFLLELLDKTFEQGILKIEDVEIKIAGNFELDLIEEIKHFKSFSCINILGRLPRTKVLKHMTKADLLWLIVGNKPTHYKSIPIKLYEYIAARRPIINFAPSNSETSKIINEYHLGFCFSTNNSLSKTDIVKFNEIISNYKKGLLSQPLELNLISKFTRKKQALQFEKIIDG